MRSGTSNFIVCGTTRQDVPESKQRTKCGVIVMYYSHGWLGQKKNQQHGRDDLYHVVPDNFDFPHIYVSWRPEEKVFFCAVCAHTELCYSCYGSQSELHTAVSTEIKEWEKEEKKATKPRALSATTRQTEKEKRWMSLFSLSSCSVLRTALLSR